MAISSTKAPGAAGGAQTEAKGLERFAWASFDWAQQPYYTLVAAFIFKPYFASGFVGDPARGQALVGLAGGIAALLVLIASPLLGYRIDQTGRAKPWLLILSAPFVLSCAGLWLAEPGHTDRIPLVVLCLIVASVCAELTVAANNSMLPQIAKPGRIGQLSGAAVALGYAGGLIGLLLFLAAFTFAEPPWLGLDAVARETDRIVGPFVAVWYLLFILPFLLWTRDSAPIARGQIDFSFLKSVLLQRSPTRRFLLGRMLVADGLTAGAVFGGVLAAGLFDWGVPELGAYGLMMVVVAGVSAGLAGLVDHHLTSRKSVLISILTLAVAITGVSSISADTILFVVPVEPPSVGDGFLAARSEQVFMALGLLIGLATGPLQASMRAWMAELTPVGQAGRWFGLFAFSNKATAFAAPLIIAGLTALTHQQRIAMPVIIVFLALGFISLRGVPSQAGARASVGR